MTSLSLALLLGSRSCSTQLENKQVQQLTQKSFQLTMQQLCHGWTQGEAYPHRALPRAWCTSWHRTALTLTSLSFAIDAWLKTSSKRAWRRRPLTTPSFSKTAWRRTTSASQLPEDQLGTQLLQQLRPQPSQQEQQGACREPCFQLFGSASCSATSSLATAFGNKRLQSTMSFTKLFGHKSLTSTLQLNLFRKSSFSNSFKKHTREELPE